jgi:hypothetical protein
MNVTITKDQAIEVGKAYHDAIGLWHDKGHPFDADAVTAVKRSWMRNFGTLAPGVLRTAIAKAGSQLARWPSVSEIAAFLPADERPTGQRHPGKESLRLFGSVTYDVLTPAGIPDREQMPWGPFPCWMGWNADRGFYDTGMACNHTTHADTLRCLQTGSLPPAFGFRDRVLRRGAVALVEAQPGDKIREPRVGFRPRREHQNRQPPPPESDYGNWTGQTSGADDDRF